jgi:NIFS protein
LHCAPLAHKFLGTFPTGTIRLSTSYFNKDEDFENLIILLDYIEENI